MSAENLPLPMLQVIRRGQGKPVSASAALKVMLPVGDMVDESVKVQRMLKDCLRYWNSLRLSTVRSQRHCRKQKTNRSRY